MRWLLRRLSTILIMAGVLMALDAGLTFFWQEPVSAIYARIKQDHLASQLQAIERAGPTPLQRRALAALRTQSRRIAFLARVVRRRTLAGQPLGRIQIPSIGASFVVVQGTDSASLQKGPGHYPATPLPGMSGTVAIAGHRTTYLAPFRHIDALHAGDRIVLAMPYGRFTYRFTDRRIVAPTALWVTRPVGYDQLVLTACNPLYSAAQRIVVFARLVQVAPLGAAVG